MSNQLFLPFICFFVRPKNKLLFIQLFSTFKNEKFTFIHIYSIIKLQKEILIKFCLSLFVQLFKYSIIFVFIFTHLSQYIKMKITFALQTYFCEHMYSGTNSTRTMFVWRFFFLTYLLTYIFFVFCIFKKTYILCQFTLLTFT